ncbi:DNA polymerase Y family protein [Aquincola sp. MAHUQ-54]|uniref:DNA polymerase Y family protein n=1 Tax=Aquincola agrisoli TaxID=3119538 RepID=A0AAW9QHQ7_9BURK
MLWLALHLRWLPLEALGAPPPPAEGAERPARAVVERQRLRVVNAVAHAAGVAPGMSTATALSLCPSLQLLARDPAREAAFVQLVAMALSCFTPHIVLQRDAVLLEVAGSLRLFGGLRGLAVRLRRTLQQVGARACIGMAPTAGAALLLARVGGAGGRPGRARTLEAARGLLDGLPSGSVIESLELPARLAELLQGIGCPWLGQVRALPRTGLQRRGGGALLDALDRAYGDAPDPQAWYEPPLQFEIGCELLHRADDAGMVAFAAQRLVQPLAGWLARQWLAAARCTLWLLHETTGRQAQAPTAVRLAMGQPTREAGQLLLLLRERLQRTEWPGPVYGLRLQLDESVALAGHEGRLVLTSGEAGAPATEPDAQAFNALIDRLSARLGPERVLRPVLHEDHRPERAAGSVPAQGGAPVQPAGRRPAGEGARPAWLLDEPLRLDERHHRPVHGGALVLRTKAERIEAGWFDGALACRDYFVAEGKDHRLRWVYRERQGDEWHWYLHGLFG